MTKLELKIPQPGVTFYGNRRLTTVTILDIKVEDGVKEVFFESLKDSDCSAQINLAGSQKRTG